MSSLKSARKKRLITQKALAHALGRSQSFVAKYESGELLLDVVIFVRICRLLGLNPTKVIAPVYPKLLPLEADRKYGYSE
ncbi:MAG: helix-turn-helix domain-containing protein [Burkholderiales bacterium]|nr:helix-turn-helix domain-containing protein [Burkholderiales bacterium]